MKTANRNFDDDVEPGMTYAEAEAIRKQTALFNKVLVALSEPKEATVSAPNITVPAPQINVEVPAQPAPQVIVKMPAAPKVVAWTFEFERNADGTIKRIHATPKD